MNPSAYVAIALVAALLVALFLDAVMRAGKRAAKFDRRMCVKFRVVDVTRDRRSKAQFAAERAMLQASADAALEKLWQERVKAKLACRRTRPLFLLPYSSGRGLTHSEYRITKQAG